MADFINLYKIKNLKTGTISDFVDDEGMHDFLIHLKTENKSIQDYAIYSLNMENITKYMDLSEVE